MIADAAFVSFTSVLNENLYAGLAIDVHAFTATSKRDIYGLNSVLYTGLHSHRITAFVEQNVPLTQQYKFLN